ncbi:MAG: hypothetical protein ABL886_14885, partial [Rhodoglobus sp.]
VGEWTDASAANLIGEHAAALFSNAISDENNAVVTSAYIRQALTDTGENADDPLVTEAEQVLIDWARWVARDPAGVPAHLQHSVESTFSGQLRVLLIAFAAQTVAASVIETALATSLSGPAR